MKVFHHIEKLPVNAEPVFLTIGNFDGVHLGHQALLSTLVEGAKKENLKSAVITFSNHPSLVLRPNHPMLLLTSKEHKLKLLEACGVDYVYMLDFTLPFSEQSAEVFLKKIQEIFIFRRLILGQNAKLGNDRQGDTPLLHALARSMHFNLDFLPLETAESDLITSSRIRKAIQNAELATAAKLLGRDFSVMGKVLPKNTLALNNLCHPPFGVYRVRVIANGKTSPATATLSLSSAAGQDRAPLLEIHLLDDKTNLQNQMIEVQFEDFLRPLA